MKKLSLVGRKMTENKSFIVVDAGIYKYRFSAPWHYLVVPPAIPGVPFSIGFEYVTDEGVRDAPLALSAAGELVYLSKSFDNFYEADEARYQWLVLLLEKDLNYRTWDELALIQLVDTLLTEAIHPKDEPKITEIVAQVQRHWAALTPKA